MAAITRPELNSLIDEVVRFYLRCKGETGGTYGLGERSVNDRAVAAVNNLKSAILAITDLEPTEAIARGALDLEAVAYADAVAVNLVSPFLQRLAAHIARQQIAGVSNIEEWCRNYNVVDATKWQSLQHPAWRDLYYQFAAGTYPAIYNLYFEVLQGATYANALRKLVVGTGQTAGFGVDQTKYAGGFPKCNVVAITGLGTVTVTGTQYDPATQTFTSGKTWTASVGTTGLFTLISGGGSPASADALIAACSDIAVTGGITAGTLYAEAHRPAGRPLLP